VIAEMERQVRPRRASPPIRLAFVLLTRCGASRDALALPFADRFVLHDQDSLYAPWLDVALGPRLTANASQALRSRSRSDPSGGCRRSMRCAYVALLHPTAQLHRAATARGEGGARWVWYCILPGGEGCSRARTTPGRGAGEPAGTGASVARRAETSERAFLGGRWDTWT
jgi:hypothetical protein